MQLLGVEKVILPNQFSNCCRGSKKKPKTTLHRLCLKSLASILRYFQKWGISQMLWCAKYFLQLLLNCYRISEWFRVFLPESRRVQIPNGKKGNLFTKQLSSLQNNYQETWEGLRGENTITCLLVLCVLLCKQAVPSSAPASYGNNLLFRFDISGLKKSCASSSRTCFTLFFFFRIYGMYLKYTKHTQERYILQISTFSLCLGA